ncbi:MAG: hypothetical protein AAFX02_02860 [Pseudomonadota bacterium]
MFIPTARSLVGAMVLTFGLNACEVSSAEDAIESSPPAGVTVSYEKGQLLTLSAAINKEGDDAAATRTEYFQRAFSKAEPLGMQRGPSFRVVETVRGDFSPRGLGLFSWPSADAESQLTSDPEWAEIKALRPDAWDMLRLYSVELEKDLDITFNPDKFYTVAIAWLNPDEPDAYDLYLDGIESTLTELGARYVYQMRSPRFEQVATPLPTPGQVTFVEWDTEEGLNALQESEGFQVFYPNFRAGVTRFELHRIAPVIPG